MDSCASSNSSSLLTDTSKATLFSTCSSSSFFIYSRLWILPQIALKEANETGYWLELLYNTKYINDSEYKSLDRLCAEIRVILIASINTAKSITANHDNASFNSVSAVKCLRT